MQCVNCQFENMPGMTKCVRCGSSLTLATADIDVNPPRAGTLSKLARVGRQARRTLRHAASETRGAAQEGLASFNAEIEVDVPRITAVVPGWPQFYAGRRMLGWGFLLGYLGFLLPSLLFLGSDWSAWGIGLAISCHLSSILDIVLHSVRRDEPVFEEAGPLLGTACGLGYLPALLFLFVFCWPIRIEMPINGLPAGDVVLTSRMSSIRVGDVVRYAPPSAAGYRVRGTWIDRVLAGGGSQVAWDGQRLTVDGQPVAWRPAQNLERMKSATWTVPTDSVFIPPPPQLQDNQQFYIVPRYSLISRVFWRTWPSNRWGPMN